MATSHTLGGKPPSNTMVETQATAVEVVKPSSDPSFADVWKNRRVISWCLLIFLLPINFGYELGSTGNILALPPFLQRFGETTSAGAVQVSAHNQQVLNASAIVGIFAAAFTTGFVSDILGRRMVVLGACVLCVIGIFVQGFCNSIPMLFGGKLISTFGFGLGHSLAPVYVAEIAPDNVRGICLALVNTMIVLGQWLCSLVSLGTSHIASDWAWRIPLLTQLVPPVLMFCLATPLLPESPSWLLQKGRTEEAAKSLRKFNGPSFDVQKSLAILGAAIDREEELNDKAVTYFDCFRGTNRRRTIIVCSVYVAQQFIGISFIAGYLPYYFTISGVDDPIGMAQVAYAIQLFGNLASLFVVDKFGRRPFIVYGTISMTALLLVVGGLGMMTTNLAATKAVTALMCVWGAMYQFTLGAVGYVVGGETPSPRMRQKTYAANVMINTAAACLVGQITPILINPGNANLGAKVAFVFFAPSVLLSIYFFFCFPEMKGRSYLELEEMFQQKIPARRFKAHKCEVDIVYREDGAKPEAVVHDEGHA